MKKNLENFSRAQLAQLGREYMVASQFNSRTGYAALRMNHGDEAYKEIAISNWLAASPVYTQRMQKAMGFSGGTDVATIFKGLQLECGLTHQYFDVHFEVLSEEKGRFWLKSCGPLLETEPRGDEAVKVMCHDIEDPTFDGTAIATNPLARMRPVHRPPRVDRDNSKPHCEWNVFIDHDAEPLTEPAVTTEMRQSKLAKVVIQRAESHETGGMDFYTGPVFEQLQLEQLSHAALVVVCKELAIQNHLLINSLMRAIEAKYGKAAANAVAEFQMTGSAWVMSNRLSSWLGCEGGIDSIIEVCAVHPAFQPCEYHAIDIKKTGTHSAAIQILDCSALQENEGFGVGWFAALSRGQIAGLEAIMKGVDSRARLVSREGETMTWDIVLDEALAEATEPLAVQIAKGTVLYQTKLEDHIQLLQQ
jgi:hypothetical protein